MTIIALPMCVFSADAGFAGNHDNKIKVTMFVLSADVVFAGNRDNKIIMTMCV